MTNCNSKDVYVALMGLTGAGKSSFIKHCTKHEVTVGDGLQACTDKVEVYSFKYSPGVTIHLVDTPGFDDTNRQDSDVLRDISAWLSKSYTEKILLNGILYLHRISDPRMQGSGRMSINLLIKLCGRDALKNVVLVTTMWELVEADVGRRREKELENTEEFWGFMKRHGSQTRRHLNSEESARKILTMFVPQTPDIQAKTMTLAIQKELADDHKTLDQTGAGQLLDGTWAKEKESLLRELKEVRDAVRMANEERDHTMARLLQEQQQEMSMTVEKMRQEQEKLRVTMEHLHEERLLKYQKMLDDQVEISRTLSDDLEHKANLQDNESNAQAVLAASQMEKLQDQQVAVVELQGRLDGMNSSSNTLSNSSSKIESEPSASKRLEIDDISEEVKCLQFSSNGRKLFVVTGKTQIRVYDLYRSGSWTHSQTLTCRKTTFNLHSRTKDAIKCLVLSKGDSCLVAALGDTLFRFELDRSDDKYKLSRAYRTGLHAEGGIGTLELSLCNSYLICAYAQGHIHWPEVWSAHMPYDGFRMEFLARPLLNKMYAIMTCVQFGPSCKIALGLDNGTVVRGTVAKSGKIEEKRLLTTPGTSVRSMLWTSDSRLLVGTWTGIFIVGSDDHIDQVTQTDLDFDRECWSLQLGLGAGICGTLYGQGSYYEVQDDGYVAIRHSRRPVTGRVPADVSLDFGIRRWEVAVVIREFIAMYDCVR
ncbi:putative zinc finger c2h2 [Fusarium flagelliforme]|uniref:Putative zinc finger c2h2 n=1 Tax=Fusarium flagelliforme TaxID=2675880 RepID=A0A395MLG1_9HYPO|nr:putative zinc finger c2h2 [Fusarium flagelliforme]